MFFRMFAIFVIALAAGGVGFLAYLLAGSSWIAAGVAVTVVLLAITGLFSWLTAVLFERFDVRVDSPA